MVNNGQNADETTFNGAFVSKIANSTVVSKLTLNRPASGAQVPDVQGTINDHESRITQNETDISNNASAISNNAADILVLQAATAQSNYAAITDPTVTDDASDGYSTGSRWINTANGKAYVLTDPSIGAAVWALDSGSGGGGGVSLSWKSDSNAPVKEFIDGIDLRSFDSSSSQEVYATLSVPSSYSAGTQIFLKGSKFFCVSTSGKVFFKSVCTLLDSSVVLGTYSNQHTSTNAEVTVQAVSNTINECGDIDLTDSVGEINSVAVAPGDKLVIKLFRDNANESSPASGDARLIIDAIEPTFS